MHLTRVTILTLIVTTILLLGPTLVSVDHAEATSTTPRFAPELSLQSSLPESSFFHSAPLINDVSIANATADSILAVDITGGVMLYEQNADQRIAPASTLKMITALTALTVFEPEDLIQVSESDLVDTTVYSNAQLRYGDQVTVKDLLAGLLIPSGGDAANALARVAGGRLGPQVGQSPYARFVEEMNEVARSLGMTSSNFVNADGPDHPDQYTTARDMAIAGREVLQHSLLAEIVAASRWTITIQGTNARQYEIVNTNALIDAERVHGIKTGTTGEAGQAVVVATRRADHQIITVVMGSESRYDDTLALLNLIDQELRWVQFGATSDFPEIREAAGQMNFVIVAPFTELITREEAEGLRAVLELGPRPRGTLPVRWGNVVFLNGGGELVSLPVLQTRLSSE